MFQRQTTLRETRFRDHFGILKSWDRDWSGKLCQLCVCGLWKVGNGVSSFGPNLVMTTEIDLRERPLGQGVLCGTLGVER